MWKLRNLQLRLSIRYNSASVNEGPPHHAIIEHRGVEIVIIDCARCDDKEFLRRMQLTAEWLRGAPLRSVRGISCVRGSQYTPKVMKEIVPLMRDNAPYMIASAVVGLEHLTKLINLLNHLAGRNVRAFDTIEEAKDWIASIS